MDLLLLCKLDCTIRYFFFGGGGVLKDLEFGVWVQGLGLGFGV